MKISINNLFVFGLLVAFLSGCGESHKASVGNYSTKVNPFIGTDWVGNVYPGATVPFGMVQLSPDNGLPGWDRISGYYYPDSTIASFSHTHLSGTGAGDLYDIAFLPVVEPALIGDAPLGIHAKFSHKTEEASAGYYSVILEPYDIKVRLTATPHCGIQAYTFNKAADKAFINLDLNRSLNWDKTVQTSISLLDSTTISGYRYSDGWARNQRVYFKTKLSEAPDSVKIDSIPFYNNQKEIVGYGYTARLYYHPSANDSIVLVTALSGVSEDGAAKNLEDEFSGFKFDDYRQKAAQLWNKKLSVIEVREPIGHSDTVFYSSLYRSMVCPTLYSDVDGKYLGPDGEIHEMQKGHSKYSTFSLWDTYRAAHPLYNIICPSINADMVQSMIDFGKQNGGHLPVWNMFGSETDMMIGHHSIPVIVESILKGVYKENAAEVMPLLLSTVNRKDYRGMDEYRDQGYISTKESESVSKTLEYAYDDDAVAQYAHYVGNDSLYAVFSKRARYYTNLWDAQTGFFRPKDSSGQWLSPFNPYEYSKHFTESNAWQYLFSVQQDIPGLSQLMGGRSALKAKLDEFFTQPTPKNIELPIFSTGMIAQYPQGNEPSHHAIFIYNYVREPWRTTDLVYKVLNDFYSNTPKGLCGNEDCGQMSAWYVFASIGLYPINPLDGKYEIFSPSFKETVIHLENGKTFTIKAPGLSADNKYIQSVKVNGKAYNQSFLTYDQIMSGATVELIMGDKSGVVWY